MMPNPILLAITILSSLHVAQALALGNVGEQIRGNVAVGSGEIPLPLCDNIQNDAQKLSDANLTAALNFFCVQDATIHDYGQYYENFVNYPPQGQTQFFDYGPKTQYVSHMTFGVKVIVDEKLQCPSKTGRLSNYDCTYAVSKLYKSCSNDKHTAAGEISYRCVHYRSFVVNDRKS